MFYVEHGIIYGLSPSLLRYDSITTMNTSPTIKSTGQAQRSSKNPPDIQNGATVIAFPNEPITPQRTAEQPEPAVVNKSKPDGSFVRLPQSHY
jgi:hypothetical protein